MALSRSSVSEFIEYLHEVSPPYLHGINTLFMEWNMRTGASFRSLSRTALVRECKERGVHIGGTREQLIHRLCEYERGAFVHPKLPPVTGALMGINRSAGTVEIRQNQWGNYVYPPNNFVFSYKSGAVIGVQDEHTGGILQLTYENMERCKELGYEYEIS